jgi:heptosyltransferase-2
MSDKNPSTDAAGTEVVYTSRSRAAEVASTPTAERARQALAHAKRIVILTKFRFMGDTIVATPFFAQLRRHYPDADITLLAAPSVATALAHCPHLNRILPVDMRGRSRWQHGKELYALLREGDYQAGFLLNRSLHCAVTCWAAHLPVRIGYINEFRRPFLTVPIPYFFDRNEVDCHLDMLRALGLPARDALPDLWMTEAEKENARRILREHGWNGSRPLIGVQPGSNDAPIREWGAERFAHVAETIAAENGGQVVLMGGEGERETAERTARALKTPPIDLVGKLPLREALAAIGQCDLWLSNDTGLLHAAVAQRVASVGMFGPNKVVRWGYDAPRHRSLVVFPDEPAKDDAAVRRCLDAITDESALETARAVLRQPKEECTTEELLSLPEAVVTRAPYYAARLTAAQLVPARRR